MLHTPHHMNYTVKKVWPLLLKIQFALMNTLTLILVTIRMSLVSKLLSMPKLFWYITSTVQNPLYRTPIFHHYLQTFRVYWGVISTPITRHGEVVIIVRWAQHSTTKLQNKKIISLSNPYRLLERKALSTYLLSTVRYGYQPNGKLMIVFQVITGPFN